MRKRKRSTAHRCTVCKAGLIRSARAGPKNMTLEQELTERTERMNQSPLPLFPPVEALLPACDFTVKFNKLTVKFERPRTDPADIKRLAEMERDKALRD